MSKTPELVAIAHEVAAAHNLEPALVCAVIEQESSWNPWAIRFEPQFWQRYVQVLQHDLHLSVTEGECRATSFGLMQIMGQTARELGCSHPSLAQLFDPREGVEFGCRKLAFCMKAHPDDLTHALLAYNGGSNPKYAGEVIARIPAYVEVAA